MTCLIVFVKFFNPILELRRNLCSRKRHIQYGGCLTGDPLSASIYRSVVVLINYSEAKVLDLSNKFQINLFLLFKSDDLLQEILVFFLQDFSFNYVIRSNDDVMKLWAE